MFCNKKCEKLESFYNNLCLDLIWNYTLFKLKTFIPYFDSGKIINSENLQNYLWKKTLIYNNNK